MEMPVGVMKLVLASYQAFAELEAKEVERARRRAKARRI